MNITKKKYKSLLTSSQKRVNRQQEAIEELSMDKLSLQIKLRNIKNNFFLNFMPAKVIAGKQASGKTTMIKSILPYINYFVIDTHSEYREVAAKNKYTGHDKEGVTKAIKANKSKTIIIEDVRYISENLDWLFTALKDTKASFILTTQSALTIEEYIEQIDAVYDLGQLDARIAYFNQRNRNKIISLA